MDKLNPVKKKRPELLARIATVILFFAGDKARAKKIVVKSRTDLEKKTKISLLQKKLIVHFTKFRNSTSDEKCDQNRHGSTENHGANDA